MEQIITKGIVLRAVDYGEKDKIITILTLDYGRVNAILKGVKKVTAKMKFASQPFCFAEFTLSGNRELKVVSGATEIESFFEITHNYDKILCGSAILEMTDNVSNFNEPNELLFKGLYEALFTLANKNATPEVVMMRFALGVFKIMGYEMNLKTCRNCGKSLNNDLVVFDVETGEFNCFHCPLARYIPISGRSLEIMQQMAKVNFDKLEQFVLLDKEAIEFKQIIKANFEIRFGVKLKSITTAIE